MRNRLILVLCLISFVSVALPALADGGGDYRGSRLEPFAKLIEQEKYDQAIEKLGQALAKSPDDADLLNLIAFSHRKSGRFDTALEYYQKALAIEPDHRGANEYLGELYLQLDRLDKARERLAVLDSECFFGCKEFDKLEKAIEDYVRNKPEGG